LPSNATPDGYEVFHEPRVIAVAVASSEYRDAALRSGAGLCLGVATDPVLQTRARALRMVFRHGRIDVDAERFLQQLAPKLRAVDGVDGFGDDGNAGQQPYRIRRAQDLVAE
jgi:hypothetical protein